jgi:predicted  nucleic acid-binding Zn-ribbon protein
MDKDVQTQFEAINAHFDELMVFLRDNMATKEDLANLEIKVDSKFIQLENKIDESFSSLHSEIKSIKEKLEDLDRRFAKLEKTSFEDNDVLVQDFVLLKKRVNVLEKVLEKNGLKIEI